MVQKSFRKGREADCCIVTVQHVGIGDVMHECKNKYTTMQMYALAALPTATYIPLLTTQ